MKNVGNGGNGQRHTWQESHNLKRAIARDRSFFDRRRAVTDRQARSEAGMTLTYYTLNF